VLSTVRVPVTGPAVISAAAGGVQVTGLVAPAGLVVTAQVRVMVPVNPFEGVAVIVAVLPVEASCANVMGPLLVNANVGTGVAVVTVTFTSEVSVIAPDLPVTVIW
jgi:Zn-dependent protease